jgi:hypothetical protein
MSYTLGTAAKATGKSKTTIHRAIKSGRISATCDQSGVYKIDPSELHRVFPPLLSNSNSEPEMVHSVTQGETFVMRRELEMLREERERERNQLQSVIYDLQRDRDHWRQQATCLLEARKDNIKRSWITRLFGRTA